MDTFLKKPILIVIAGPNGSGKTSITGKILDHEWVENCLYVNPDIIAKEKFGDWNSYESVMKAVKLSEQMREECIESGKGLIFETVLSANDKIEFIRKARDRGYFIRLFFVGTENPAINASRVAQRVMEGGHDVPITKIISRFGKSISNCCIVSKIADRVYVYDNSNDFEEARLLFRVADGKIIKQYNEINKWALPVFKFLEKKT